MLLGTSTATGTATDSVTVGSAVPAGWFVALTVAWSNDTAAVPTITGVADSRGNTYTVDVSAGDGNGTVSCAIITAPVTTPLQVGDEITVTISSSRLRWMMQADARDGVGALDQVAVTHVGGVTTAMTTGTTPATTAPDQLLVAVFAFGRGGGAEPTLDAGWSGSPYVTTSEGSADRALQTAYKTVSATGTQEGTATLSVAAAYSACIATYALTPTPVGRATGTGTARPVTAAKNATAGRATGTGTARAVVTTQLHLAGRVTSTGTARALTAGLESSGLTVFPDVRVEVAFSVGANLGSLLELDDPTRGLLDTGTLGVDGAAGAPVWTDIREYVRSITISRGSQRIDSPQVTYEPGTLSVVLDNTDRRFDPGYTDGPYVDPDTGATQVTAMRAVRVLATWDGTVYELWRGFADEWIVDWQPGSAYSECVLTATDAAKVLSGDDRTALPAPVGGGEDAGARVTRILNSVGWPLGDRVVGTGQSTLQATDLSGDAWAELQTVAASELGEVYVDGGGRVVFRGRHGLLTDERSTESQGVFGDGPDELPVESLAVASDDATFFNEVRVTVPGGEEQAAADTESQDRYYRKTYRPSTEPILETDAEASGYAHWLLHLASEPELRFTEMELLPSVGPVTLWPHVLGREIGDRITAVRRPPPDEVETRRDHFIRGITHEITDERWTTRWALQDASRYAAFFVLDHAELGVLDANALAY